MNIRHGMYKTPTYSSWRNMLERCTRPDKRGHAKYNMVGYDPSWGKFENFFKDMGQRPNGKTLDREDNTKGYCKSNCQWSDVYQQNGNKDNNNNVVGVRKESGKFRAYIYKNKKKISLGTYAKYEEAVSARHRGEDVWKSKLI